MVSSITFFHTAEDLEHMTGLSRSDLWNHGFNLDDMDWGIVSPEPLADHYPSEDGYYETTGSIYYNKDKPYEYQLLTWMDNYCVGFCHTVFKGKHYYTLHHS